MASPYQKALWLSLFTVGYNLLEGVISVFAAWASGSTALLGFGLDSFIESLSGTVMVWRFWQPEPDADEAAETHLEQKAGRYVAYTLFVLGLYVTFNAGHALYRQEKPETSLLGLGIATASILVMPVLFLMKYRLGKSIGSRSLVADSKETLACVLLSFALLIGLGAYAVWQIWWIDAVAALVIALLIFREGIETFQESRE